MSGRYVVGQVIQVVVAVLASLLVNRDQWRAVRNQEDYRNPDAQTDQSLGPMRATHDVWPEAAEA
jgi:hypothetical protein